MHARKEKKYFTSHQSEIEIIGHGDTIEHCFTDIARIMFSFMSDIQKIHIIQIITFEFEAEDLKSALIRWLDLLLVKSRDHHLMCTDFRLKREGKIWKATVSGEKWHASVDKGIEIKKTKKRLVSIKKINHSWVAHCLVLAVAKFK